MITEAPIQVEDYLIEDDARTCGAVVTFTGVVRAENNGRPVSSIRYDCYRAMAEREMKRIVDEVSSAAAVRGIRAVHRVGILKPGDLALIVVVAAGHRRAAFEAVQCTVDEIKRRVPIWKQEHYADATAEWL